MNLLKRKQNEKSEPNRFKTVPNLEIRLDMLSEENLFNLGYIVLQEVFLVIRRLPHHEPEFSLFWSQRFGVAAHNIPLKLKDRDTVFFKQEILHVVTHLFNCSDELIAKGLNIDATSHIESFINKHQLDRLL